MGTSSVSNEKSNRLTGLDHTVACCSNTYFGRIMLEIDVQINRCSILKVLLYTSPFMEEEGTLRSLFNIGPDNNCAFVHETRYVHPVNEGGTYLDNH